MARKSGFLFAALYTKQCGVSLQRYYAGTYSKGEQLSMPIALTRSGIPLIIPSHVRKVIRRRDERADKWVRIGLLLVDSSRWLRKSLHQRLSLLPVHHGISVL